MLLQNTWRSCWGCSSWAVSFSIIIAALTGLEMTACEPWVASRQTVFQSRYFHPVRFASLIRRKHLRSSFRLGLPFLLSSFLFPGRGQGRGRDGAGRSRAVLWSFISVNTGFNHMLGKGGGHKKFCLEPASKLGSSMPESVEIPGWLQ